MANHHIQQQLCRSRWIVAAGLPLLLVFLITFSELAENTASAQYRNSTLAAFSGNSEDNVHDPLRYGALIADANGNLYGTTCFGGANDDGTVFEVANDANHTLTTLAAFNGTNGANPFGGLIADSNGNLFGTTHGGGANGVGTVFELTSNTHAINTLVTFNTTNGALPYANLIADANGNLYGTTDYGGNLTLNHGAGYGSVFEVANDANHTLTTLVAFNSANGANPLCGLIADANGNLYGTTYNGGANGFGTVFEVANDTHAINTLATFNYTNGAYPVAALVTDSNGNLFGTTQSGTNSTGTVFEVANDANHTLTTLATFSHGANSFASLVTDANGNLYGTTVFGDANSAGAVFKVAYDTNHTLTTEAKFDGSNGQYPTGLLIDANGNLYGTTRVFGANGDGTVFELSPVPPPQRGDINRDGHVDASDIMAMMEVLTDSHKYELTYALTDAQLSTILDINRDGDVNNADLQSLLTLLQSSGGSTNPVPEPSTFALTVLAFGILGVRRRGR